MWRGVSWAVAFTIVLASVSLVSAQGAGSYGIPWEADRLISWSDFRGPPPPDAALRSEAAAIHMTIAWHATYTVTTQDRVHWIGRIASVTVTNTMDPTRSWVVPGKASAHLLQHEQTHFDLNEVYRRRIEILLQGIPACAGSDQNDAVRRLDTQLHAIAEAELQTLQAMQSLYDAETAHGIDRTEQTRWEEKIRGWLQSPLAAP